MTSIEKKTANVPKDTPAWISETAAVASAKLLKVTKNVKEYHIWRRPQQAINDAPNTDRNKLHLWIALIDPARPNTNPATAKTPIYVSIVVAVVPCTEGLCDRIR